MKLPAELDSMESGATEFALDVLGEVQDVVVAITREKIMVMRMLYFDIFFILLIIEDKFKTLLLKIYILEWTINLIRFLLSAILTFGTFRSNNGVCMIALWCIPSSSR